MEKIPTKTWVGLLSNLLVMLAGIYTMGEKYRWDSFSTGFAVVMSLAFLVSLMGVVMLVRGNPAGGIVGAVGSAFFVPIGLICLMGCLQSRDNIRFAGYASGTPATTVPAAPVDPVPPAEENPTREVAGEAAAGEAAHVESAPGATPLAAYRFMDERPKGCLTVIMGLFISLFLLAGDESLSSFPLLLIGGGIVILVRDRLRANTYACALYREYLECVPGRFSGSVRIPYADILEAEAASDDKAYLYIKTADGREKITVRFCSIAADQREEAHDTFTAKMRELGVLREQPATE